MEYLGTMTNNLFNILPYIRESFHPHLPAKRDPRTPTSSKDFFKNFAQIAQERGHRNGRFTDKKVFH